MNCLICLNKTEEVFNILESTKSEQDLIDIIRKHLWFLETQLNESFNNLTVCKECWKTVENFDSFFNKVQEKHESIKKLATVTEKSNFSNDQNKTVVKVESCMEYDDADTTLNNEDDYNVSVKEEDSETPSDINKNSKVIKKYTKGRTSKAKEKPIKEKKVPTKSEKKSLIPADSEKVVLDFCKMKCELCSIEFTSYLEMKQHYTKEHKTRGYVSCCSRKFYKFCRIWEHVQYHLNPNVFQCEVCLKSYTEKGSLFSHKKIHSMNTVNCTYEGCDKVYASTHQLRAHVRKKHEVIVEQVECDLCAKVFSDKLKLKSHLSSVHSQVQFVCDLCGKMFATKGNLRNHHNTHFETERVQCGICLHWLKNATYYKVHMKSHEEEKDDHICTYCEKKCKNVKYLKKHIKTVHLAEWKFRCTYCEKLFKRERNLTEHVAALHTGETLYGCMFCHRTFNSSANMAVHRKRMHPVEWEEHIKPKYLKP